MAHFHELNETIDIVLSQAVSKGEEIVLNDDIEGKTVDNNKLFDLYGIMVPKTRDAISFQLSVGLTEDDQMYGNKREMWKRYFKNAFAAQDFFLRMKKNESILPKGLVFAMRGLFDCLFSLFVSCSFSSSHCSTSVLCGHFRLS